MMDNPFAIDYVAPQPVEDRPEPAPKTKPKSGAPVYHSDLIQGSDEWLAQRCGKLTASEMKLIITMTGGGMGKTYRATGNLPEKPTPRREQALTLIGDRDGSIAELALIAGVSDGLIRDLVKDGAIEAVEKPIPLSFRSGNEEKAQLHLYELLAQRVTNYVEPHFQSYDMERGNFDEEHAREKYSQEYAPVEECGFITNDKWGFTLGYSPDGLVGDDGLIECKSRVQKWQMKTLVESVSKGEIPDDYVMQVQTALLVSEREWCDFISYSGGMVMPVVRCHAVPEIQEAIVTAARAFEARLADARQIYDDLIASNPKLIPTERLLYL